MSAFREFLQQQHSDRKRLIAVFNKYGLVEHSAPESTKMVVNWCPTINLSRSMISKLVSDVTSVLGPPYDDGAYGSYWQANEYYIAVNHQIMIERINIVVEEWWTR